MAIEKGSCFSSFDNFRSSLKRHEEEFGVLFVITSSKKLKKESPFLHNFKYENIRFACKQGHRTKKSTSQGMRPNQRTFKIDCPAFVNVHLVEDADPAKLQITTCNLVHENHPTGPEFSRLYPENRKPAMTSPLKTLLSIKSVTVQAIKDIVGREGKVIFSQDVRNMKHQVCDQGSSEESVNVAEVLESLQAEGGMFKYGTNEGGEFKFLAFMTKDMLCSLRHYPEVLIMDTTYKVNKNNYPLLNVLIVDNNGQGRPVFHAFLASEDTLILSSCLSFFVSTFNSSLTKTIFVDKDMAEICAIRSCLPSVSIRLCAFHTATAVKKALQQRKLPSPQISCLLALFAEQKSSTDLSQYNALKDKISELSSPDILSYFNANWWNCPQLWAASFLESSTFHITTTNHAETFHQKIKRVLSSKTTLSSSIIELLAMTKSTMQSRDASATIHAMSLKYNTKLNSDIVNAIQNDLTPFGAKIVIEQFLLSKKIHYVSQCSLSCPDRYILSSLTPGSFSYDCTVDSCSCDFFVKFHLPCRHIFALRSDLCLPIYQCDNQRFKSTNMASSICESGDHGIIHEILPSRNASTPESRFHITKEITKAIESFFPLLGEHAFQTAINHLNRVFNLIRSDRPLAVIDLSENEPLSSESPDAILLSNVAEPPSMSSQSINYTANMCPAVSQIVSDIQTVPSITISENHSADNSPTTVLSSSTASVSVNFLPTLSEPSCSSSTASANFLPTLSEPSCSSSTASANFLPTLSEPSCSSSTATASANFLPTLSEPSCSSSTATASANFLPTLSEPSCSSSTATANFLPTLSAPPSPSGSSCGFSKVKLSVVKTKGRPRQVQAFTRRYGKRKACPQAYESRLSEEKKCMLLSGCLLDTSDPPPYSVSHLKLAANLSSILANSSISFALIEDLFLPEAWETLQARVLEKKANALYSCNDCAEMDDGEYKMIECEGCLEWFHYHCVGMRSTLKPKKWFCLDCWL